MLELSRPSATKPPVCIGMPVFNGEAWLAQAMNSLLSQTFRDFELIISDNGSTDRTPAICQEYLSQDSRIRYFREEINRGLVWNWNRVFELSNAKYFKWSACDDVYHPRFLERCVEALDDHPEVVWCHSRTQHINAQGALLKGEQTPEISYDHRPGAGTGRPAMPSRTSDHPAERFRAVLLGCGGCLDSYGVIRSSILRKSGGYLAYFGSEKVLMAELALWGRYYEVPEPLCFARVHEQAAGNLRTKTQQRQFVDPFGKRWQCERIGLLRGYIAAVRRSELSLAERLRCYAAIGEYLLQFRKWRAVVKSTLTGAGLRAEYPSIAGSAM